MQNRLRIYYGPDDPTTRVTTSTLTHQPQMVTVPASQVFSALVDAIQNNRTWVDDFADDKITISSDLYEIILAYQHIRRPSA